MTQAPSQATPGDGPLAGVRVLDLSRLVAGNMLSLQLADFGAEVIKLEPDKGDPLRDWQEEGISSLLEPLHATLGPDAAIHRLFGRSPSRTGNRVSITAPRNVYLTADGEWVALSASTQDMAFRLFAAIGRADMADDPRFSTNAARLDNVEEVDRVVGAFIGRLSLSDALAFFERAHVTVGPVYDPAGFAADPHVRERGVLVEAPDADTGTLPMHAPFPRLSRTPGAILRQAPALGQDEADILGPLG